jgi:hypothetical protein
MILLILLTIILTIALVFFAYQSYKLGNIILRTQDAIEASLDVLDERYKSISEILQKPIFFDSMEVRQVIEDISISRDAVLFVANQLVSSQEVSPDGKKDTETEEVSQEK